MNVFNSEKKSFERQQEQIKKKFITFETQLKKKEEKILE